MCENGGFSLSGSHMYIAFMCCAEQSAKLKLKKKKNADNF